MSELVLCRCGHDVLSHPSRGVCMDSACDCALFTGQHNPGWTVITAPPDPGYDAHLAAMREAVEQHAKVRWLKILAEKDRIEARTRLLDLAWWLLAGAGPVLAVAAVAWAVVVRG